ncbi:MAG: hypothetical protein N3B18_10215 [Desulfobacterota bacterium]|nr:hypothetical protein [Thermodesulfobacteriota bacterium]
MIKIKNFKNYVQHYAPWYIAVGAIMAIAAGIAIDEHHMIFSYAIVVCLNCIGLG